MFDKKNNISGHNPIHIDYVYNKLKPFCEEHGYKFTIIRGKYDFLDGFNHVFTRSKTPYRNGLKQGFPIRGKCYVNDMCKRTPMRSYIKNIGECTQYIGIAIDEPKRLKDMKSREGGRVSLLEKYNFTEQDAKELCKKYNLLSPLYETEDRDGCWFCPNMHLSRCEWLLQNHKELWEKLKELEASQETVYQRLFKEKGLFLEYIESCIKKGVPPELKFKPVTYKHLQEINNR